MARKKQEILDYLVSLKVPGISAFDESATVENLEALEATLTANPAEKEALINENNELRKAMAEADKANEANVQQLQSQITAHSEMLQEAEASHSKEIEALKSEHAKALESLDGSGDADALKKEIAELNERLQTAETLSKVNAPAKKVITVDGQSYVIGKSCRIEVNGHYEVITDEDILASEELQKHLITIGSGMLRKVS